MITGLESDFYCCHNPIPIEVQSSADTIALQINIGGIPMIDNPPVFYPIAGVFKIDISTWVRQFMAPFRETKTYTDMAVVYPNDYVAAMEIVISGESPVTRRFVHCALDSYVLSNLDEDCCVKIWKCYPFSSPLIGWESRVLMIPDEEPEINICGCVDFDESCCQGVYLKWLNARGYYSYWLFPNTDEVEREGDEILRTDRNIFDRDRTSNEDTVGFDVTEKITVRDKIPKPYWSVLKTLTGSPEVYMLNPTWELGSDECTPSDWIKIIQDKPTFSRLYKNNSAEFEMTFDLPKVFSQKRL